MTSKPPMAPAVGGFVVSKGVRRADQRRAVAVAWVSRMTITLICPG